MSSTPPPFDASSSSSRSPVTPEPTGEDQPTAEPDEHQEQPEVQRGRTARALHIFALLTRTSDRWNAEALAKHLGVTTRTIHRDLKVLRHAGLDITFSHEGGVYVVSGENFLPPLELTSEEAIALNVLCRQVAEPERISFTRPAARAMRKLSSLLPAAMREEMDRLVQSIAVQTGQAPLIDGIGHSNTADRDIPGPANAQAGDAGEDPRSARERTVWKFYELIQRAITERRCLLCRYRSRQSDAPDEEFDFEPYLLLFSQRAWYVIGYHSERDAIRTLKLQRFVDVRQTHRDYTIPESFTLESYLGNAWRMVRGERDHAVELHFDAAFAGTIAEARWHHTQSIEQHKDGSITFRCTVSGFDEILWWILSMGSHCRVKAPQELADRVQAEARKMLKAYAGQ